MTLALASNAPLSLKTGCKINLFLKICSLRQDGYHELESLFYPLAKPFDELVIEKKEEPGLELICPKMPELCNENTTLHKALAAFEEAAPEYFKEKPQGFKVVLHKDVPAGGGLGGGSANAAGFLRYLNNQLKDRALHEWDLVKVAAKVGADVPFFLLNSPALATGIGEKLSLVQVDISGLWLLLICPSVHVSTPWAYGEWDRVFTGKRADEDILHRYFFNCLTSSNLTAKRSLSNWPWFYNNLENAVFPTYPELGSIKEHMLQSGARAALMSGSGSTIFALFDSEESAQKVIFSLKGQGTKCYLQQL